MALAVNLNELINGDIIEWERLEFKAGWNPESVMHTICAFANDINNWGGGYIVIGIKENKGQPVLPPIGLNASEIDRIQGEIIDIGSRLYPNFIPVVEPYIFQGKHILVLYAPAGDNRPYSAPESLGTKGSKTRQMYIRNGSRTIIARTENLRRLQELSARIPFDDRVNQIADLKALNLGLIRDYLHQIQSELAEESTKMTFPDLCRIMNIAKGPNELLRPVNAGLMFFSNEPHKYFQRAWIEVVVRHDEAGKDFEEKYFKGPLQIQLQEALGYIRATTIRETIQKHPDEAKANRFFNFPFSAVEEALSNAVYHKSYELDKPIEVQIWPSKIEILSFPGPVPPVNAQILAENKRIVARDYRNRRIGDYLKEYHLTEGRGTGIPTIYKALEVNGSPEPTIETDENCTYFLVTLFAHKGANLGDSDQDSDQDSVEVSDQDKAILKFCLRPRSSTEILAKIGLSSHSKNYQRHIEPLLDEGSIEMTVPEKPTSRNQKYITTEKGKRML